MSPVTACARHSGDGLVSTQPVRHQLKGNCHAAGKGRRRGSRPTALSRETPRRIMDVSHPRHVTIPFTHLLNSCAHVALLASLDRPGSFRSHCRLRESTRESRLATRVQEKTHQGWQMCGSVQDCPGSATKGQTGPRSHKAASEARVKRGPKRTPPGVPARLDGEA